MVVDYIVCVVQVSSNILYYLIHVHVYECMYVQYVHVHVVCMYVCMLYVCCTNCK